MSPKPQTIKKILSDFDKKCEQSMADGGFGAIIYKPFRMPFLFKAPIRMFLEEKLTEIVKVEKEKHLTELSRVLNLHSNPTLEGGLDYEKGFKEVEKYETELAQSLVVRGHSINVDGNCNLGCC